MDEFYPAVLQYMVSISVSIVGVIILLIIIIIINYAGHCGKFCINKLLLLFSTF